MANETKQTERVVPGIGTIPEGWDVTRVRNLFTEISERYDSHTNRPLPLLSVSEYYGVAERADKIEENEVLVRAATLDGYKKCRTGDLVSNIMLTWKGALGISPKDGIVSPAYCVYRPAENICGKYYHYLFRTQRYADIFRTYSTGLIDSRLRLYSPKFYSIMVPHPPLDVQEKIANHLDKLCDKIDEIITEAKASIEEYKAWKSSIIYEAVTKGLDPTAEMKDSGVAWLEQIPTHVNISRVGLQFDIILGKMLCPEPRTRDDTLEKYYCAANVHFDGVSQTDLKQMWFNSAEKERYLVKQGDLLVVEGGAGAGGCAICSTLSKESIYIQNSIMIVRPRRNVDTHYLKYLIEFLVTHGYVDFVCNKATIPHFTKEKLANVPFPMFTHKEQKNIAQYLDGRCSKIDELIAEKSNLISDLESYKKSLIYEVVTGKRKVC